MPRLCAFYGIVIYMHTAELDHAWQLAQALEPLVPIDPLPSHSYECCA